MTCDKLAEFEPIFYPKSVAVIGASASVVQIWRSLSKDATGFWI